MSSAPRFESGHISTVRQMKRILAMAIVIAISTTPPARAADCIEKACIEVYTQDGHIVIEGRKGKGPASTKVVIPAPAKTSTPRPKATKKVVVPVPTVKTTKKPAVKKIPRKPKVKKSSTSATSLQDKLVESIPTAGISYQPSFSPLVKTPVYFWSDIPTLAGRSDRWQQTKEIHHYYHRSTLEHRR